MKKDASIAEELSKAAGYALSQVSARAASGLVSARHRTGRGERVARRQDDDDAGDGWPVPGGQKYRELILFQDKAALDKFPKASSRWLRR